MGRRRLQQNGDLYEQGGWWKLRWREDQRKSDGSIKYAWSRPVIIGPATGPGRMTEREARRNAWDNFLSRLDQNMRTPQSIMTVAEFVERRFLPEHVVMLKPLSEAIRRGYSVQTAKHIKNVISGIFTHAEEKGWFSGRNPAYFGKLPEMGRRPVRALSFQELRDLLQMLRLVPRCMVLCASLTSMNIAEVCGLRWKRVNLSPDPIIVDGESIPGFMRLCANSGISAYGSQ